jgi:hypothetical protein
MSDITFTCPVCKRVHSVPRNDSSDYVCTDNENSQVRPFLMINSDSLTQNNWALDRANTRTRIYPGVTVFPKERRVLPTNLRNW